MKLSWSRFGELNGKNEGDKLWFLPVSYMSPPIKEPVDEMTVKLDIQTEKAEPNWNKAMRILLDQNIKHKKKTLKATTAS